MKFLISIVLLFLVSFSAFAEVSQDAVGTAFVTRANKMSPLEGLGTVVNRTKNLLVVVYDFAVQGGAVGDLSLLDDQGNSAILPYGAVVQSVGAVILTDIGGNASATVALRLLTSADLMAATAKASLTSAAFLVGKPLGGASAGLWVGPVTGVNGQQIYAQVGTTAVTAGKIKYFIEYVLK